MFTPDRCYGYQEQLEEQERRREEYKQQLMRLDDHQTQSGSGSGDHSNAHSNGTDNRFIIDSNANSKSADVGDTVTKVKDAWPEKGRSVSLSVCVKVLNFKTCSGTCASSHIYFVVGPLKLLTS